MIYYSSTCSLLCRLGTAPNDNIESLTESEPYERYKGTDKNHIQCSYVNFSAEHVVRV